jgi:hypothetical protein
MDNPEGKVTYPDIKTGRPGYLPALVHPIGYTLRFYLHRFIYMKHKIVQHTINSKFYTNYDLLR